MEQSDSGRRMGHEFIGVVEAVGAEVQTVKAGDLVVSPFLWSDGTCAFCREGLQSECLHGGRYGFDDVDGGQGEAVRVPQADGTLVVLPVGARADRARDGVRRHRHRRRARGRGGRARPRADRRPRRTLGSRVRRPGAVGRVGLPQEDSVPDAVATFFTNVTIGGGPAPVRAYIEELLPDVLDGRIEPGRVFDRVTNLDGVLGSYQAMNKRQAIKVLIELI